MQMLVSSGNARRPRPRSDRELGLALDAGKFRSDPVDLRRGLTPAGHEIRGEQCKDLRQLPQAFRLNMAHDQGIPNTLDFDFLRDLRETKFPGDAHSKRVADLKNAGFGRQENARISRVYSAYTNVNDIERLRRGSNRYAIRAMRDLFPPRARE